MLRRKFSLAIVVYLLLPAVASADSAHGRVAVYAIGQLIRVLLRRGSMSCAHR